MLQDIRHPDVSVQLTGQDGNAFSVLGIVAKGLRHAGYADEVNEFMTEAMDGDYDHLLATAMKWVNVS